MPNIRLIQKRTFAGGELKKIAADHAQAEGNRFIALLFDELQSKRLTALERLGDKNQTEQSRDYWAGYAEALKGIKSVYDNLAKEVNKELKDAG